MELGIVSPELLGEEEIAAIEAHVRTGRPRSAAPFIETLEARTGRMLKGRSRDQSPVRLIRSCVPGIVVSPELQHQPVCLGDSRVMSFQPLSKPPLPSQSGIRFGGATVNRPCR